MPELPEVERARRLLEKQCKGKKIVAVDAADDTIVYTGVDPQDFAKALVGRTIAELKRHGKQLWIELDQPPHPMFHFGMTGNFEVRGVESIPYRGSKLKRDVGQGPEGEAWPPRFTKCLLRLEDGIEVAFTNARRLGRIRLQNDPRAEPPVSELGFDALLELPALDVFSQAVLQRSAPIKALLLDQSFAAGIGNWIADEVLFQSRIHPSQPSNTLLPDELTLLHGVIRLVVAKAVELDADSDGFPTDWLFHNRWGKGKGEATTHDGKKIDFVTVGGRTSAIVPSMQKLFKNRQPAASAPTKKASRKKPAKKNEANGVLEPKQIKVDVEIVKEEVVVETQTKKSSRNQKGKSENTNETQVKEEAKNEESSNGSKRGGRRKVVKEETLIITETEIKTEAPKGRKRKGVDAEDGKKEGTDGVGGRGKRGKREEVGDVEVEGAVGPRTRRRKV